jgi:peptide/nickel transport system substrate-binding protein
VADEKRGWQQFREIKLDRKKLSRHVKRAEDATTRHARKFVVARLGNIRGVRRQIISWLLLVGIMITAVGIQYVWFQQSYQTTAPARGGTYAEASLGAIETLNPLFASTSSEIAASRLMFSSLYSYDSTGHLHGDLAESMSVDETNTLYTVKIRSDAKWHDGVHLTAKDVAFTVDLIKNPETRSSLRVNWKDVVVKAVDDTTVQFRLPAVYAAFPNALTFSVLPSHSLEGVEPGAVRENTFSQSPIGSGPFSLLLLQSTSDHKIVQMVANDKYYGGKPMLSRFEVHAYDTQDGILDALDTGEVSAAADLNGVDSSQINTDNYNIASKPVNSGVYALLNTESPILKDKPIREALQLATDTSEIRANLKTPVAKLDLPFIDSQLTGSGIAHPPAANSGMASALLERNGWVLTDGVRKKGSQKLELTIATTKNAQYEKALETITAQWKKIGVNVITNIVDTNDPSTNFVQNVLQARNYDVLLYELFIGADPDVYAYWNSSQIGMYGYNFSNYSNGLADASLASARSRLEPDLRMAKYKTFVRQWVEDVPAIGLYQPVAQYVYNKHVKNVEDSSKLISSYDRFYNVLDWSVNQKSVYKTP